ncbi:DUF1289 domain-containing protein [Fontimonas sp. SYSU GA230001]|uniref:DUF1289 domain-containing protein n=1 Tax=Fontimonas sp. SYSU GA230001 TaxID=3142450 RepID=UPI0032B5D3D5
MTSASGRSASGQDVASPCIGVCALDARQVCTGCGRTLAEIAEWSSATPERKREIRRRAVTRMQENKA